jgi:hypothetical protein
MPGGRPTKFTPKVQDQIAEMLWLAFTDAQIAEFCDLDERSIRRARAAGFSPAIKRAELGKEIAYRKRIWEGALGWQGAAWYLERKYPQQFSRETISLQVNANTTNTTNITISAVEAHSMVERLKSVGSNFDDWIKKRKEVTNGDEVPGETENGSG